MISPYQRQLGDCTAMPNGDELRRIARSVRTSASDDANPTEYVLAGWKAAMLASPTPPAEQQATKKTSGGFHVWRDISTAPKDGSRFVAIGYNYGLYSEGRHICVAQWFRGCWMETSDWNEASELQHLTHWLPLPSPPDDVAAPAKQQAQPSAVYAGLPERRRVFLCTKCGGRECESGSIHQTHPPCKCGYLGFAENLDFTEDQMRDFADRTHAQRMEQATPKAAQEEMDKEASNARLDIDSNSTEPEQQREVACSLEVGQHVGNGEHQEASCRGSKDSELLKIAARNLKYFIAHAQFSSFADKQAALDCIDILAAPQAAPAWEHHARKLTQWLHCMSHNDSYFGEPAGLVKQVTGELNRLIGAEPKQEAQEPHGWLYEWTHSSATGKPDATYTSFTTDEAHARKHDNCRAIYTAPQPAPAPLNEDVVKNAARYAALRDGSIEHDDILKTVKDPGKWEQPYAVLLRGIELDSAIDAALKAQGENT